MRRVKDHKFLYRRGEQYYFRRKVPKGLEWAFGDVREVPVALQTSELTTARRKLAVELEKFERTVEAARSGSHPPSDRPEPATQPTFAPTRIQIEQAVRRWLAERIDRASDTMMHLSPQQDAFLIEDTLAAHQQSVRQGLHGMAAEPSITSQWLAEAIAERENWPVARHAGWWRVLTGLCGRGQIEADEWQAQDFRGDPRSIGDARFHPEQYRLDAEREKAAITSASVNLTDLLALYLSEKTVSPATAKVWKRHVAHFIAALGHEDAAKVTSADVVGWKERLLAEPGKTGQPLSHKTIRESYLACIKALFAWALENGKISGNPAANVRVAGKSKSVRVRDRGLTDAEAELILEATLRDTGGKLSPERALARRWVPWICAYTGARVNEITQLRGEDVAQHKGVWTVHITPEAGSTKTGQPRTVALHSHLLEQGFLAIVQGKEGPIFYDPALRRHGSSAHPQNKKVGEFLARWVRNTVGVTDPNVWPNHGWRHRFKTLARVVHMDREIRDYIQGHAHKTEGEAYGHVPPEVTCREIEKMQRYALELKQD